MTTFYDIKDEKGNNALLVVLDTYGFSVKDSNGKIILDASMFSVDGRIEIQETDTIVLSQKMTNPLYLKLIGE